MSAADLRHQPVAFDQDEQRVTVAGYRFVAQEAAEPGRCKGCEFIDGFGCALWREARGSLCQPQHRLDGRSVIWVREVRA